MFQGSMVALVTPMSDDGAIDYDTLAQLIEFHIDNKTDVLVAVGTTGESATLDFAEHNKVISFVVKQARGRVPVMAGTGANSTKEALDLTREAKANGADACLLVTPYYNKPPQEGLFRHYEYIAKRVAIPQILYNVPGRTACDMSAETVGRLSKVDNIVGIKEASSMARCEELFAACDDDFMIISGEDDLACEVILKGGKGVISVVANVVPKQMHDMCAAALQGDADSARALNKPLRGLHREMFAESNPIPTKWALHKMGLIGKGIRLPLVPLAETYHKQVLDAMREAGVV